VSGAEPVAHLVHHHRQQVDASGLNVVVGSEGRIDEPAMAGGGDVEQDRAVGQRAAELAVPEVAELDHRYRDRDGAGGAACDLQVRRFPARLGFGDDGLNRCIDRGERTRGQRSAHDGALRTGWWTAPRSRARFAHRLARLEESPSTRTRWAARARYTEQVHPAAARCRLSGAREPAESAPWRR
jgi:hypothetical protein